MNIQETNSGSTAETKPIKQKYLGEIRDSETIEDLEAARRFVGGDFALELRGDKLHLFRVMVEARA